MTSDAKLPIQTWVMSAGAAFRLHVGSEPSGDWCKADDVCGLVERMEEGQRVIIRKLAEKKLAAQEQAIWMESERDKAEAQRDRLAELLRRTMTDTACVEVDGPGCWFCDRDDGAHTDGCEAAEALADIEKENA